MVSVDTFGSKETLAEASVSEVLAVQELPKLPKDGAYYVFDSIPRSRVTKHNHGLHKYPAKFIPQIPRWALQYRNNNNKESVLDPFCGSGTTLVEVGLHGGCGFGCDISPLAVMITKAKTSTLNLDEAPERIVSSIIANASELLDEISNNLILDKECLGLHYTWSFWFRKPEMAKLLALRKAIEIRYGDDEPVLANFLLVCLSSIAKSASYLNEDQIKVRFDHDKKTKDPFESFFSCATSAIENQIGLNQFYQSSDTDFSVHLGSAAELALPSGSIDRVITSPPYINAIDYTMAHKYNLFVLGLIQPSQFKGHCRDYIGVTERAVRASDIKKIPETGIDVIDRQVNLLWGLDTPVSRNRSFVVCQYFKGMYSAFQEMFRVTRSGGKVIMVVGDSNKICKKKIETASIIKCLAELSGFETELCFHHLLANRSSMRLNRSVTGGQVKFETIYVFHRY